MNLIEARKAAHEGWVRSPTRTGDLYIRFTHSGYEVGDEKYGTITAGDLDAEDWEPKLKPAEPWESELWVYGNDQGAIVQSDRPELFDYEILAQEGWRKIRVREVVE